MQEQVSNVNRESETLRKNQKAMLENKSIVMEECLDGLISKLGFAKENSELKHS